MVNKKTTTPASKDSNGEEIVITKKCAMSWMTFVVITKLWKITLIISNITNKETIWCMNWKHWILNSIVQNKEDAYPREF